MPLIINHGTNLHTFPTHVKGEFIVLKPGPNPVPDSQWALVMKGGAHPTKAGETVGAIIDTPGTRALFEENNDRLGKPILEIKQGVKVADPNPVTGEMVGDELLGLPGKDAATMASTAVDEVTLKAWLKAEKTQKAPRQAVLDALAAQLDKVNLPAKSDESKDSKHAKK